MPETLSCLRTVWHQASRVTARIDCVKRMACRVYITSGMMTLSTAVEVKAVRVVTLVMAVAPVVLAVFAAWVR